MSDLVRQAVTILFARGFIRIAQFVAFLLLARFMTPAEFGWFGIVTTAMTLAAMLGSLGLRQSFTYEIGQKRMTPGEAVGTTLVLWPVLTLFSAAVIYLLYGDQIPGLSSLQTGGLIVLGVAATMFVMLIQGVYLGRGDINAFSFSETLPRIALMIFAAGLALTASVTLFTALWAHVGGFVLAVPVALWLALRGAGKPLPRLDRLGGMLGYGLIFAFNLFVITLCSRISMFVIENYWGAEAAGQFFAAVRVNEIFLQAATALGMVLFSNAARQEPGVSVLGRNARIACWIFWFFLALAILVAFAAPQLLTIILGGNYAPAGTALQILAFGLAPAAAGKVIYPTLAGQGKPFFGTPVIIFSLLINLGLAFALVPTLGVHGGAWALVVGQYVLLAGYMVSCRRLENIPFRTFLVPRIYDLKQSVRIMRSKIPNVLRRTNN
ncbi:oligosaccharide flippase family protein [Pelagibacterium nitratireducens]|uniref:Oligosaccharide flippase family protein n=1 Tax=Pelagibacterium nitratireducens TaxID=1046114 RepID=A0ABZ2I5Y1_9HYPH